MAKATPPRSLEELIQEAAKRQLQILQLEKEDGQLTPSAFVDDALSIPGASKADGERLLVEVQRPENALLLPTFRRLKKAIRDWPRTRAPRRINSYFDENGDTHLARMRISRESLVATAAMAVAKETPEIFGAQTRAGAYEEKIKTLVAERQTLFDEIQQRWRREDCTEHPVSDDERKHGLCKLSLKCCADQVFVGPDLGLRATNWWCNSPAHVDQLRKAA